MKGEQEKIERIIRIKDRRSILTHFVFAMNATKPEKGMVVTRFEGSFGFTNVKGTIIEERFFRDKFLSYLLLPFIVS